MRSSSKSILLFIVTIIVSVTLWRFYDVTPRPAPPQDSELVAQAMTHALIDVDKSIAAKDACAAELGRQLFFDPKLSRDGNVSCATCHIPELSFTDGKPVATALGTTDRNTPTLINMRFSHWFFWDGRADSLAAQMLGPLESDVEHGFSRSQLTALVLADHRAQYEKCFGAVPKSQQLPSLTERALPPHKPVTMSQALAAYSLATQNSATGLAQVLLEARQANLAPWQFMANSLAASYNGKESAEHLAYAKFPRDRAAFINRVSANAGLALAAFQNTIVADNAPFDQFIARLKQQQPPYDVKSAFNDTFDERAWNGFRIFAGFGECTACHQGPTFSDQQFHNIGLGKHVAHLEPGRAAGLRRALQDPFNCKGGILPHTESESCRELDFLDIDNIENMGAFKTPTLRNLATTAPYMHDGRFKTLDEVLDHYNRLTAEPALGHREETLKPMQLSSHELLDLTKFLQSLNSEVHWMKR